MDQAVIGMSASLVDGSVQISEGYLNSIIHAGGIPFPIPIGNGEGYFEHVCNLADGFLFCGGGDIHPSYYGETDLGLLKNICSIRDELEKELFKYAYATGKPILGICRGMQVINVFLGGSLHQHITGHVQAAARCEETHHVRLIEGGMLKKMLSQGEIWVNSFHHQAVKMLAPPLIPNAVSHDGYVEAFHGARHPFLLGVQWHPEAFGKGNVISSMIFNEFIGACIKRK